MGGTTINRSLDALKKADTLATATPVHIRKYPSMTINTYSPHRLGRPRVSDPRSGFFWATKNPTLSGGASVGLSGGGLVPDCLASPYGQLHALVVCRRAKCLEKHERLDFAFGLADQDNSANLGLTIQLT